MRMTPTRYTTSARAQSSRNHSLAAGNSSINDRTRGSSGSLPAASRNPLTATSVPTGLITFENAQIDDLLRQRQSRSPRRSRRRRRSSESVRRAPGCAPARHTQFDGPDDNQPCPGNDPEDHDRADRQGQLRPFGDRARHSREDAPATFGQFLVVNRQNGLNSVVSQPNSGKTSSGHQDGQRTLPKWFRGYL
jgi:hypothetical protein